MTTGYSKPFTFKFEGIPMAEVSEVDESVDSEDKAVKTLAKGFSGHSDGAEMGKVTFKSALPLAGYERDFYEYCRTHRDVTLGIKSATKETTYKGRFTNVSARSSVDTPNEISGTFEGKIISRVVL